MEIDKLKNTRAATMIENVMNKNNCCDLFEKAKIDGLQIYQP